MVTEEEVGGWALKAEEGEVKECGQLWMLEKTRKPILPCSLQKECGSAHTLILDFWPLEL